MKLKTDSFRVRITIGLTRVNAAAATQPFLLLGRLTGLYLPEFEINQSRQKQDEDQGDS